MLAAHLRAVLEAEQASFHMPGHKGGRGAPPLGLRLFGPSLYEADVSELGGFDYLHGPTSALVQSQRRAAEVFGADRSFFLVNGATAGNLAALFAVASDGDRVLVARNSHRSVYAGLVLSGAEPRYLRPLANRALDGLYGLDPDEIAAELDADRSIRAVHVTSPSFYGLTLPLTEIAVITSARGVPLIVDEAHGSHFYFHEDFPTPALAAGADAVVQSPHKTLGSLTQSSLLHLRGERVDAERIDQALQMLQSSSPSALLLVSLDLAIEEMAKNGHARWGEAIGLARFVRDAAASIPGLSIYGDEVVGTSGISGFDPCKLVVDVSALSTSGQDAARWLRAECRLNPEFSDLRRIVFSITNGDDAASAELLVDALRSMATSAPGLGNRAELVALWPEEVPPMVLSPRAGTAALSTPVSRKLAIGRVAAEMIVPYPPGVPLLVPGELITEPVLDTLVQLLDVGCKMVGMADPSGATIRCVSSD